MPAENTQIAVSSAAYPGNDAQHFQDLKRLAEDTWDSEPKRSLIYASEILAIGRKRANSEYIAVGSRFLGVAYMHLNEPLQALPHSLEALDLFVQLENHRQVAAVQIELGMLHSEIGAYLEAIDYFEQSIATNTRTGSRNGRFVSLHQLAQLHRKLQNYDKALMYCDETLQLARELSDEEFETVALGLQGDVHLRLGEGLQSQGDTQAAKAELTQAKDSFERAYTLSRKLTERHTLQVEILIPYANLNILLQNDDLARNLISEALSNAEQSGSQGQLARCLQSLGVMNRKRNDLETARQQLERAQNIYADQNMKAELTQTHRELAIVFKENGDPSSALAHFEQFHELDASLRNLEAAHRAQALAVKLDLERTKRESELYQLRSNELSQLNERLQTQAKLLDRQAREDALTGLANRRHLEEYAFEAFERAKDRLEPLSLVIADIDHFKLINDQCSHSIGDQVLQIIATILRSHCRRGDLAARYGGEEFVFVLTKTSTQDAWRVCERVRQAVRLYPWGNIHPNLQVTISLGFSSDLNVENHERMLAAADQQLYAAKHAGRNRTRPEL